jgi:hypothetical protein
MARGRKPGESPRYWTQEEEAMLTRMVEQKTSLTAMAWKLNRTDTGVLQKIRQLKLPYQVKRMRSADLEPFGHLNLETIALRVNANFSRRLTEFCHDHGATRSYFVESVVTAFMNQVENGAGE